MSTQTSADPLLTGAAAAAQRLRAWLLDGPAQLRAGPEAGGVAGTLQSDGSADYVYGEITGYYLHWLAGSHLPADPRRQRNAQAALQWCERRYVAGTPVPTRIMLRAAAPDWRNQVEFCFDLAMLVGGVCAARAAGLIAPAPLLLDELLARCAALADSDGLLPAAAESIAALPSRWSTRRGPFLVKAAARLQSAAAWQRLAEPLAAAIAAHLAAHPPAAVAPLAEPMHPTLYFLEGLLALAPPSSAAATLLDALLDHTGSDGSLPESSASAAVRRSDIIAQALRVGFLLQPCDAGARARLDPLVAALIARVQPDGAIAFQPGSTPAQWNVWCAMFAEQALSWYLIWRGAAPGSLLAGEIV